MKRRLYFLAPLALLTLIGAMLTACASTPSAAPTTAAPAPAAAPTTTAPAQASPAAGAAAAKPVAATNAAAPKYGGTLNLAQPFDIGTFDDPHSGNEPYLLGPIAEDLWGGDWTKGPAGGYGTKETAWDAMIPDVFSQKTGFLAESWKTNVDNQSQQATLVLEIRPGVHYYVNPSSDLSKQIGGRTVTADDVVASIQAATTNKLQWIYRTSPELKNIDVSKTGPMEVTIKVPLSNLATAMTRLMGSMRIYPTEIRSQDTTKWQNLVATGPFMITSYVHGSSVTYSRNPNYWMKDPIGPGKGNQLPYMDGIQSYIIPDASTRLTALRTAKIDYMSSVTWEDAAQVKKEVPQLKSAQAGYSNVFPLNIRTDKAPYTDIRVRQALMYATDFNAIKQSFNGGNGIINTYPYEYYKGYAGLYVGVDDPTVPAAVKDLFAYNPTKAKQLLAQAGFPNGLKTSVITSAPDSDYMQMLASMWAKAGITLNIDLKDQTAIINIANTGAYNDLIVANGKGPVSLYYTGQSFSGTPAFAGNVSRVNDPYIQKTLPQLRVLAATDEKAAMGLAKQIGIYALEHVWAIPRPAYNTTSFWWPWIKNYSGELKIGVDDTWYPHAWIDQDLKKSMGH